MFIYNFLTICSYIHFGKLGAYSAVNSVENSITAKFMLTSMQKTAKVVKQRLRREKKQKREKLQL